MLSVAVLYMLDYIRISFPVTGPTRKFIQAAIFRKFLNYKRHVREHLPRGDVIMGIERHSLDLISSGYCNILLLVSALLKIVLSLLFKLMSMKAGSYHFASFGFMFLMPFMLMIFLQFRNKKTTAAFQSRDEKLNDVASQISVTEQNCELVLDYKLQSHCEKLFLNKQAQFAQANRKANQISMNNTYFCKWCQVGVSAIWIMYGGRQVIKGDLSVGYFVANLKLFDSLGSAYMDIYKIIISMMNTFPALINITTLLNLPTEVKQRCLVRRSQRQKTKNYYVDLISNSAQDETARAVVDMIPIVFDFMKPFKFEGQDHVSLNFQGYISMHQGQLIAVVGAHRCGKATLLRLLAATVFPAEGQEAPIFAPGHLRIANVAESPLFFNGSLYENLIWGLDENHPSAARQRVIHICSIVTENPAITDFLDLDVRGEKEESWQDIFSATECKLLAVARALIHNSEVCCIHNLFATLTPDHALHVLRVLRRHVEKRGLRLSTPPEQRRLRTVFISAAQGANEAAMNEVDTVLMIDSCYRIKLFSKSGMEGNWPLCFAR
mmetsp:Transcript_104400/g.171741  ORF Transcript_104400/g.171741 Transcript_104400/m.171741 type:complete len:551 (-) Transcript_104400:121-1773(-)